MPVFNGAAFLEDTLHSLSRQQFRDYEILCIDDNSPDESAAIIVKSACEDRRVRYLKTPYNFGIVSKVLNYAASFVRGRHFIYTSQDDSFSPDWLQSLVDTIDREGVEVAIPNLHHVDAERQVIGTIINDWRKPISGIEAFILSLDWTVPANAMWPLRFLTEIGYSEHGTYADEYSGRKFFLESEGVAFASGTFEYFHGNPLAITKQISQRLLDVPYNEFLIWELVAQSGASEKWRLEYSRRVVASLVEAYVWMKKHPSLRAGKERLLPALESVKREDFRRALREASDNAAQWAGQQFLLDHERGRQAYAGYVNAERCVKAWISKLIRKPAT